jgi:hypothetical protein
MWTVEGEEGKGEDDGKVGAWLTVSRTTFTSSGREGGFGELTFSPRLLVFPSPPLPPPVLSLRRAFLRWQTRFKAQH